MLGNEESVSEKRLQQMALLIIQKEMSEICLEQTEIQFELVKRLLGNVFFVLFLAL